MSEKGVRNSIVTALLILSGTALLIYSGFRYVPDNSEIYTGSGRTISFSPITMPNGTIGINSADQDELTELYGIGETLATMIMDERVKNGDYCYPEDLTAVKGIGMKKLEGFREYINLD